MNPQDSERINVLRFPLAVFVVFFHNIQTITRYASESLGHNGREGLTYFIRHSISFGLGPTAVPLFFTLSSYLLFHTFEWSVQNYINKCKSRIRTLLIPYVFWNATILLTLSLVHSLAVIQEYFPGKAALIESMSVWSFFDTMLGITVIPINNPLWYIQHLMILVLAMPLIYPLLYRLPALAIGIVFIAWFFKIPVLPVYTIEAVLFFFIGAAIAIHKKNIFHLDSHERVIYSAFVILLIIDFFVRDQQAWKYVHRITIATGVLSMLCLSGRIIKHQYLKDALLNLAGASFFVYIAHEPALTVARKIAYKLIRPESSIVIFMLYLIIPIALIGLLLLIYRFANRSFPRATRFVTGGR